LDKESRFDYLRGLGIHHSWLQANGGWMLLDGRLLAHEEEKWQ
jgi:hypothetical protein